jgi:hypothetical protein
LAGFKAEVASEAIKDEQTLAQRRSVAGQAGWAADGEDGPDANLSEDKDQPAASGAPCLSLPVGDLKIDRPDQVWCADINYLRMNRGFAEQWVIRRRYHNRAQGDLATCSSGPIDRRVVRNGASVASHRLTA